MAVHTKESGAGARRNNRGEAPIKGIPQNNFTAKMTKHYPFEEEHTAFR